MPKKIRFKFIVNAERFWEIKRISSLVKFNNEYRIIAMSWLIFLSVFHRVPLQNIFSSPSALEFLCDVFVFV